MNSRNLIDSHEVDLLIVEDEPSVSRAMVRHFAGLFRKVLSTQDTAEGLTIIESQLIPYSTVISDQLNIYSPEFSGMDLGERTNLVRVEKDIPFYLMSGGLSKSEEGQTQAVQRLQDLLSKRVLNGFFQKPFDSKKVRAAVLNGYKNQL